MQYKQLNFYSKEKEIVISGFVMKKLYQYRQLVKTSSERGGLLFGHIVNENKAIVDNMLEVKPEKAGPSFCWFSSEKENKLIKEEYKRGSYLLGKWHTHYENIPRPSNVDISSMKEYYLKSEHNMPLFLMLIIGKNGNLYLGGFNEQEYIFTKSGN